MTFRPRVLPLLLSLGLGLSPLACGASPDDAASADDAIVAQAAPLTAADFPGPLTRDQIRRANANLADDLFAAKWTASLESPVIFMRSYPGAYHADLARVAEARLLGEEGICFGDAHPDNFGFVQIGGKTRFVFNDLDDSGLCLVGVDAARYFAVLRLYFGDDALTADVLQKYVDTVKDVSQGETIADDLVPDLDKHRIKDLATSASGGKLVLGGDVQAATPDETAALTKLAQGNTELAHYTVEDVASLSRAEGGSGGLRRYWLLVTRDGVETILELKEAATPGTDLGRQSRSLSPEERLGVIEGAFWGEVAQGDYYYVDLLGGRFLVRNRLTKKSVDFTKLDDGQKHNVLHAQATIMAKVHSAHWRGVAKEDLSAWLSGSSKALADRWSDTYGASKK